MNIDSGEVEKLIDAFEGEDEQKCIRACEKLKEVGEIAVPSLVEALRREDWPGRSSALWVLGSMGAVARSAIPDLITIVGRRSSLSAPAVHALERIGDPSAVPCLIEALSDENYLCTCAAGALGRIGDPRAVGPLIGVLRQRGKFWVPRGAAAVALGEFGEGAREALPALEEALRYDWKEAGDEWDDRAQEAVKDAIDRIRGFSKETKLKGYGYRYEMWGIY